MRTGEVRALSVGFCDHHRSEKGNRGILIEGRPSDVDASEDMMGKLIYGCNATEIEFDDRILLHLRRAILIKLRRNESFTLTWKNGAGSGNGHTCIWLHPAVPLEFHFYGNRDPSLNLAWVEMLIRSANNQGDMQLVPEPPDFAALPHHDSTGATSTRRIAHSSR